MVDYIYVENTDSPIITARSFTQTEVQEINYYVKVNVPSTMVNQLLALTDVPEDKAKIFVAIYRILNNAKNSVSKKATYIKLKKLLDNTEDEYYQTLSLLHSLNNIIMNFQKRSNTYKLNSVFMDKTKNTKINRLIDLFLVFAEKQEMLDLDKTTGIDLDTQEGKLMFKDLFSET